MVLGSEGAFGIITEAWVRCVRVPKFRASATIRFPRQEFLDASAAVKAILQSGLRPANCRLVSAGEALSSGLGDGGEPVLILGFESCELPVMALLEQAIGLAVASGGIVESSKSSGEDQPRVRNAGEEAWRTQFIQAPYLKDAVIGLGWIAETFETCVGWAEWPQLHQAIMSNVQTAIVQHCGSGRITCRLTHAYQDGPAPYYTVLAAGLGELTQRCSQWEAVKKVASDTLLAHGATATHHHAVGRMHQPWFEAECSNLSGKVLAGIKSSLDPGWIMNPGVLVARKHKPNAKL
eukprot:TRINITY_DN19984_c0_g1_i2.p1 TRINITY_DN19984_c0_g1~~TRINITY_DN19984_c0_g1_i2.p1  ORF type:complete len:293 (-),score=52.15 TRINITY_DN19984_c0_g1_i2:338-1216(-)